MLRTALAFLILATTPVFAQERSPIASQQYGVICALELQGQQTATTTESGVINLIDQARNLDVTTHQVPAELGLSFGIRALVADGASLEGARMSVTHPPMGPRKITHQSWSVPLHSGAPALNMFTFESPHELVQGTWVFQLIFADKVLTEKVFQVLPAGSVPVVQKTCGGVQLTS
ncbi:DUF3859 domain-containing protein [Pelagimonas varians]|uniref:DUF3859 domain-containing protein n=1 Tax=Pelagimonas varians TaxID=696760 RepID=A0A238KAL8_9RHOB|nr:DUF3859 domain-containing protein [Pelagimonas varians]PYG31223.1 uncharacterized protein DUF3859 [Pelagimonas varians]SMX39883.1 hypothetical protein PEV8663_01924 [Pelagimonas varians]